MDESSKPAKPGHQSALLRAHLLQQQAAAVGFDWPDVGAVGAKLKEEMTELGEVLGVDVARAREELGDVLFMCAALARHLGDDPESLMQAANRKFERRFSEVKALLKQRGLTPEAASLEDMEAAWIAVKSRE